MHANLDRILIDEVTLKKRIKEMAQEISRDYADENLLVIGLRGYDFLNKISDCSLNL